MSSWDDDEQQMVNLAGLACSLDEGFFIPVEFTNLYQIILLNAHLKAENRIYFGGPLKLF